MSYKSEYDGIIFIEGTELNARVMSHVKYKRSFYNQQSKTLDDVKKQLALKAQKCGANAVMNFKYGQKSDGWFRALLLSLDDDVTWYGDGDAVVIPEETYNQYLQDMKK